MPTIRDFLDELDQEAAPTKRALEDQHHSATFRAFDMFTPDAFTADSYRAAKAGEVDAVIRLTAPEPVPARRLVDRARAERGGWRSALLCCLQRTRTRVNRWRIQPGLAGCGRRWPDARFARPAGR